VARSSRSRFRLEWGKNPRGEMGRTSGLDEPDEFVQVDPAIGEFACQRRLEADVQQPRSTPRGDRLRRPPPILELERHIHLATAIARFLPGS
jgi:hypothetical protein